MQIFGHMLDAIRRIHVHRKSAAVDHDAFVNPTELGGLARDREAPVFTKANTDQQPIPPGSVVGKEKYRAGTFQDFRVADAVTIEQSNEPI